MTSIAIGPAYHFYFSILMMRNNTEIIRSSSIVCWTGRKASRRVT